MIEQLRLVDEPDWKAMRRKVLQRIANPSALAQKDLIGALATRVAGFMIDPRGARQRDAVAERTPDLLPLFDALVATTRGLVPA